jgi:23S rRNA (guanosine2251-2'-O)-methyltransferase
MQPVREAIRVRGAELERLLLEERDSPRLAALERFARDHGVGRIERVPLPDLERLARGTSHQGVAALAPQLILAPLEACFDDEALLGVALDQVQDPHNFGAVIRCAVALGNATVLWAEHGAAPLSTATFRASAGAVEHAQLVRVPSLHRALAELVEHEVTVVGLDAHADASLLDLDLTAPTVFVVGSEDTGLRGATRRACSQLARLVDLTAIDSLNASVAAALALHTALISRMKSRA